MAYVFKGFRSVGALLSSFAVIVALCSFKISPIVGSYFGFFSAADVLMPLTGVFGIGAGMLAALTRGGLSICLFHLSFIKGLVYHMPGMCASMAWARPHFALRVALPLLCMALFVAHPIGWYAAPYALYWLIPVVIYFSGKKTIFTESLATTFIAHAVGSVMWLYLKNLPVAVWLGLIPVVAVERLLYALAMTGVYYFVIAMISVISCLKIRSVYLNFLQKVVKH